MMISYEAVTGPAMEAMMMEVVAGGAQLECLPCDGGGGCDGVSEEGGRGVHSGWKWKMEGEGRRERT